jgi:hypothetical protein
MDRNIISVERKRQIIGSYSVIEHRFIREGHINDLSQKEILLYFFLVVVSDRNGISFYGADKVISMLKISEADYFGSLSGLEQKDYILRAGNKIQLLSLPPRSPARKEQVFKRRNDTVSITDILKEIANGSR